MDYGYGRHDGIFPANNGKQDHPSMSEQGKICPHCSYTHPNEKALLYPINPRPKNNNAGSITLRVYPKGKINASISKPKPKATKYGKFLLND